MKAFMIEHWVLLYGLFMYAMGHLSMYFKMKNADKRKNDNQ